MRRFRFFIHSLAHLATDGYGGFLAPLLPLLAEKHDLSLAMAGLLVSVQTVSASLLQPLWATISDRHPSRLFVIAGVLSAGIFFSLIGIASTTPLLALTIFAGGMGIACFHPMATSLASSLAARRKGMAIAFFITGGSGGYALGPVFISLIVAYAGLRATPLAVFPALLVAPLWYFFGPKDISGVGLNRIAVTGKAERPKVPLRSILLLTATSTTRSFIILTYLSFMVFYLKDIGIGLQERSYYLFALQIGGALGVMVYGGLSDSLGRWRVMFWTPLLAAPLLALFLVTKGILSLVLLFSAGSLMYASAPAVVVAAQKLMVGREGMASALQIGFAWGTAGLTMGLVGKIGETIGVLNMLYIATVATVSMSIYAWLLKKDRSRFEA